MLSISWECESTAGHTKAVTDFIRSAYNRQSTLGHLLQDALVLPIFDGGNVGVRRRQIERIFSSADYDPWEASYGPESVAAKEVNGKS